MNPIVIIQSLTGTFQRFTKMEAASGIVLLACTMMAMLVANSHWSADYFSFWETTLSFQVGNFEISKSLLLWINDGLMAVFFFLVGLEIKREIMAGELATLRKATLPIFAAIGGMLVPALIFILFHDDRPGYSAWGIPMATDIAFALGILMLLGRKVPVSLKVFLTAFAIVDDIGAVLIIAFFYSGAVQVDGLILAGIVMLILVVFNLLALRMMTLYLIGGLVVWYGFLKSGIHPTVAGVLVALTIPANRRFRIDDFVEHTHTLLQGMLKTRSSSVKRFFNHKELNLVDELESGISKVLPPLQKIEHNIHGFVAFGIMPLFALANAGVTFKSGGESSVGWISWSIITGLVLGKSLGVSLFSWIGIKLGWCDLPRDMNLKSVFGLGLLGGVGFTMALFIANLALDDPQLLDQAKTGVLIGSLIAGSLGFVILKRQLRNIELKNE